MKRIPVKDLLNSKEEINQLRVCGWIRTKREGKGICFAEVNDGSSQKNIQLVVEELVSNSITHGYGEESDQLLTVALHARPDGVTLVFGDQAPPFDLSRMTASDPDEDQIGGLGINLILGFARQIRYQRVNNSNITEIDL